MEIGMICTCKKQKVIKDHGSSGYCILEGKKECVLVPKEKIYPIDNNHKGLKGKRDT